MNADPLEKDIERYVVDFAKSLGVICYKFTSPAKRSVPDRIFVLPGGRVFWIEFKRAGKHPTASQEVEIERLRKQGATVYVVDTKARGKLLVGAEFHALGGEDLSDPTF